MEIEKLVRMANQVGDFYAPQSDERAAAGVAKHVKDFWDPRMRAQIFAHLDSGGEGLAPRVREGLRLLHGDPPKTDEPPKKSLLGRLFGGSGGA